MTKGRNFGFVFGIKLTASRNLASLTNFNASLTEIT